MVKSRSAAPPLYTDQQVITATGMPIDSLRRLITWGAVRPAQAGGGRGRVRLWTTRQALRISVTAQFAATGFSLQMAHTLTYCIPPLDNLLTLYDPETLILFYAEKRLKFPELPDEHEQLDRLTKPRGLKEWPMPGVYLGSETLIIDGRYLYSDAWGGEPLFMAEIDAERQRVVRYLDPARDPELNELLDKVAPRDVHSIDRSSLLLDRNYVRGRRFHTDKDALPQRINGQVFCKSLLSINLALGLVLCVRQLRGLSTDYAPSELPPPEEKP